MSVSVTRCIGSILTISQTPALQYPGSHVYPVRHKRVHSESWVQAVTVPLRPSKARTGARKAMRRMFLETVRVRCESGRELLELAALI